MARCCSINWKHLPIKLHYFFLYAGTANLLIMIKDRSYDFSLTFSSYIIVFSLLSFCMLIFKFMFGFIADKWGSSRYVLFILLVATSASFFAVSYLPSIKDATVENTKVSVACRTQRDGLIIYLSDYEYDPYCDKQFVECILIPDEFAHLTSCIKETRLRLEGSFNVTNSLPNSNKATKSFFFKLYGKAISELNCDCLGNIKYSSSCKPNINTCNFLVKKLKEYKTYIFWTFYVITCAGSQALLTLTDALCFDVLQGSSYQYGKQRLWGTIGSRLPSLMLLYFLKSGILSKTQEHSLIICVLLVFYVNDMFLLCLIPLAKNRFSVDFCKNIRQTFCSLKTLVFILGILIFGILSALDDECEPQLFSKLLNAGLDTYVLYNPEQKRKIMRLFRVLSTVLKYFVSEIPFFFFSRRIVKIFGHFYSLIAAFVIFSVKMGLYFILENRWWGLPIQLLHGMTYPLFLTAVTLYAVERFPRGILATMLGIFGGIFTDLGLVPIIALSALEYNFEDNFRRIYLVASIISFVSAVILTLLYVTIERYENKLKVKNNTMVAIKEFSDCVSQEL